jgi:hypothetical protein
VSYKPTIAVDYDGTIVNFAFPVSGPPKAGVREALAQFQQLGYHVLIYSCRTCKWFPEVFNPYGEVLDMSRAVVKDMVDTLAKHGIPYDEIDDGTKGKPVAEYYIDDKGLRFNDNWPAIMGYITVESKYRKDLNGHTDKCK